MAKKVNRVPDYTPAMSLLPCLHEDGSPKNGVIVDTCFLDILMQLSGGKPWVWGEEIECAYCVVTMKYADTGHIIEFTQYLPAAVMIAGIVADKIHEAIAHKK